MRLVFVTQTLDPEHGALAQTLDLVRALAQRTDELHVLTRDDRWGRAPGNVVVRTFDARNKAARAAAFELGLNPSLRGADGVLVHMVPTFLALAAPQARVRRVPLLLWYTHWNASRSLRLATRLADVVLSVDRSRSHSPSPSRMVARWTPASSASAKSLEAWASPLDSSRNSPRWAASIAC